VKIAIIGQTLNKNWANKISGGIQTVERLHVRIFLSEGHEVFFITPGDSEVFNDHKDFHLCKMQGESQEFYATQAALSRAEKSAINKKLTAEIRDWVNEIKPDVVINHSFSSSHVRLAAELAETMSVACFIHNTPDTAMDIGIIAKVQFYKKLMERGGALVCVSRYQRDLWRVALRQRVKNGESFNFLEETDIDKIYDNFCYPVYVDKPIATSDPNDHFIVITRPDPIKNLHKLLELSVNVKPYPLHIYVAHPGKLEENEYYATKLAPRLEILRSKGFTIELHHHAPRTQLLEDLATARGCFIPCTVEAAPVVLLEASALGVRSIVFARAKKHGTLDHAANDLIGADFIELVNVTGSDEIASDALSKSVEKIRVDAGDRQKLSEMTLSRHSFSNRTYDIMALISKLKPPPPARKSLWE
jgi:glycosyltransferase involved in cell wall biosynthesis